MRSAVLCFALMALAACVWAQAPAQAPAQEPAPQSPPAHHGMHHDRAAMHQKHMQEMKDQVAKMRATLDQMKANLSKVKDPAVKEQSQLDIDLWEAMVKHMEGMVSMMSQHEGGMTGGTHHDMEEKATPPASDSGDKK
jgi:TolA-binding protein